MSALDEFERAIAVVTKPGGPTPQELAKARLVAKRLAQTTGDGTYLAAFDHTAEEWLADTRLSDHASLLAPEEDEDSWDYADEDMPPREGDPDAREQALRLKKAKEKK